MRSLGWLLTAGLVWCGEQRPAVCAEPFNAVNFVEPDDRGHYFRPLSELSTIRGQLDEPLVTDRPDFTEASSTVGRGVVQLEAGYTFGYDDSKKDGSLVRGHGAPETLWRIGITDDVEFRFFWNYAWERTKDAGTATSVDGAEDISLGAKIDLREQQGSLPEAAVIVAGTVPTGASAFSNNEVSFGVNLLYSWELENGWGLAGSTGFTTARAHFETVATGPVPVVVTNQDRHVIFNQSVAVGIPLTDSVGMYLEYFGLFTAGRESNFPENFVDGGFTYLVNNDVQLDWRVGLGLNEQAQDLFSGAGISVRY